MESRDVPRLREIHSEMGSGSSYPLPDFESNRFVVAEVIVDDHDIPVMLVACRRTVEAYFLLDKQWESPHWRWASFGLLYERAREKLKGLGYSDVQCWIEPSLVEKFGMKRLVKRLGWIRSSWVSFFKEF